MNVRHILEQLEWFRDELLAQEPFLVRIPEIQLTTSPLPGVPSLMERYGSLMDREGEFVTRMGGSVEPVSGTDIASIVRGIAERRGHLLALLPPADELAWQQDGLATWAFEVTLSDGDALRQVAERMHESALHLARPGGKHGA